MDGSSNLPSDNIFCSTLSVLFYDLKLFLRPENGDFSYNIISICLEGLNNEYITMDALENGTLHDFVCLFGREIIFLNKKTPFSVRRSNVRPYEGIYFHIFLTVSKVRRLFLIKFFTYMDNIGLHMYCTPLYGSNLTAKL